MIETVVRGWLWRLLRVVVAKLPRRGRLQQASHVLDAAKPPVVVDPFLAAAEVGITHAKPVRVVRRKNHYSRAVVGRFRQRSLYRTAQRVGASSADINCRIAREIRFAKL